jgi:hypothetical protein
VLGGLLPGPGRLTTRPEAGVCAQKKRPRISPRPLLVRDWVTQLLGHLPAARTAARASTAAPRLVLGFVDPHLTSVLFGPVKRGDGRFGPGIVHFYKSKSARATGFPIADYYARFYGPVLGKEFLQITVIEIPREVAGVKLCHTLMQKRNMRRNASHGRRLRKVVAASTGKP